MKKSLLTIIVACSFIVASSFISMASTITMLAGDKDSGEDRTSEDTTTNMDYFVFKEGTYGLNGPHYYAADNDKGFISWSYDLPQDIGSITGGSILIRAFDIDPADKMVLYYANGDVIGELLGLTKTNEIAVNEYTTRALNTGSAGDLDYLQYWTLTNLSFSSDFLHLINSQLGSPLSFKVKNMENDTYNWGVVIDYAEITLNYNPVPEPGTILLFGTGLVSLFGIRRRKFQR